MVSQQIGNRGIREVLFEYDVTASKLNYQRFTISQPVTGIRVEAISPATSEGTETPICEVEIKYEKETVYLQTIYRDLLIDNGYKRCGFCPAMIDPKCAQVIEVFTRPLLNPFSNFTVKIYLQT